MDSNFNVTTEEMESFYVTALQQMLNIERWNCIKQQFNKDAEAILVKPKLPLRNFGGSQTAERDNAGDFVAY